MFIMHAGVEMRNRWPDINIREIQTQNTAGGVSSVLGDIPYKTCSTLKGTPAWAKKDSNSVNIYVN